jgi:polar amino acid transport system substrate-binding protein
MQFKNFYRNLTLRAIGGFSVLALGFAAASAAEGWQVPQFRHVDLGAELPRLSGPSPVKLLTDEDFPPFSFRREDGSMAGLSIDLARVVCTDLKLSCEIIPKPWAELLKALAAGEGDAIISGVRMSPKLLDSIEPTRPYYWALARFAIRAGESKRLPDSNALDGMNVGTISGSAHAAYLAKHFPNSKILQFANGRDAQEALRTGQIDALFADATRLIFWTRGKASRACCVLMGGAFFDPETFSNGLSIAVRRGRADLRAAFDYALDRAQTRGMFAEIMRRYLPESPW